MLEHRGPTLTQHWSLTFAKLNQTLWSPSNHMVYHRLHYQHQSCSGKKLTFEKSRECIKCKVVRYTRQLSIDVDI